MQSSSFLRFVLFSLLGTIGTLAIFVGVAGGLTLFLPPFENMLSSSYAWAVFFLEVIAFFAAYSAATWVALRAIPFYALLPVLCTTLLAYVATRGSLVLFVKATAEGGKVSASDGDFTFLFVLFYFVMTWNVLGTAREEYTRQQKGSGAGDA